MAQSAEELKIIHLRRLATPGRKYYGSDEQVYLGNTNGSLRLLDKASVTTFKQIDNLNVKNVQSAIEFLNNDIIDINKRLPINQMNLGDILAFAAAN